MHSSAFVVTAGRRTVCYASCKCVSIAHNSRSRGSVSGRVTSNPLHWEMRAEEVVGTYDLQPKKPEVPGWRSKANNGHSFVCACVRGRHNEHNG